MSLTIRLVKIRVVSLACKIFLTQTLTSGQSLDESDHRFIPSEGQQHVLLSHILYILQQRSVRVVHNQTAVLEIQGACVCQPVWWNTRHEAVGTSWETYFHSPLTPGGRTHILISVTKTNSTFCMIEVIEQKNETTSYGKKITIEQTYMVHSVRKFLWKGIRKSCFH